MDNGRNCEDSLRIKYDCKRLIDNRDICQEAKTTCSRRLPFGDCVGISRRLQSMSYCNVLLPILDAHTCSYIYLNNSAEREFLLRERARFAATPIYAFMRRRIEARDCSAPYVASLLQLRASRDYSTGHCEAAMIGDVVATVPLFSRSVVRILDSILNEPDDKFAKLRGGSVEALEALEKYVREALPLTDDTMVHHGLLNAKFFCAVRLPIRNCLNPCSRSM